MMRDSLFPLALIQGHLLSVNAVVFYAGELMIIMEYCPYGSLESYLSKRKPYFTPDVASDSEIVPSGALKPDTITYRVSLGDIAFGRSESPHQG